MAIIPLIGLILASRDNSPKNRLSSRKLSDTFNLPLIIPIRIARSKYAPSFFKSAGDKFTTILFKGKSYPEFVIADLTLSLDSLTSVPARPTIEKHGIPLPISISTSMILPSIPSIIPAFTLLIILCLQNNSFNIFINFYHIFII